MLFRALTLSQPTHPGALARVLCVEGERAFKCHVILLPDFGLRHVLLLCVWSCPSGGCLLAFQCQLVQLCTGMGVLPRLGAVLPAWAYRLFVAGETVGLAQAQNAVKNNIAFAWRSLKQIHCKAAIHNFTSVAEPVYVFYVLLFA